jgi:hypothetical protein
MDGPFQWEKEFLGNLKALRFAERAWGRLADAKLDDIAKVVLYQYHAFGDSVPAEISEGLGDINSRLERLKRADRMARKRQDDGRARMFATRREQAIERAAETPWPFRNEQVETAAVAAVAYSDFGALPLDQATAVIGDGRQALERYGGKMLLAVLRVGANAHGVRLSLTELVELADTAHPSDPPLDRNTLQRFLAQPAIKHAEQAYRESFEELYCQIQEAKKPI